MKSTRKSRCAYWSVLLVVAATAADLPHRALCQELPAPTRQRELPPPQTAPPEPVAPGERLPGGTEEISRPPATANAWRYRQFEGRWWYYQGPNQWLWWDGQAWHALAAAASPSDGPIRRFFAQWRAANPYHEHHGWVGGFYSSGGGYGASDFGYGYGVPNYGPAEPFMRPHP